MKVRTQFCIDISLVSFFRLLFISAHLFRFLGYRRSPSKRPRQEFQKVVVSERRMALILSEHKQKQQKLVAYQSFNLRNTFCSHTSFEN